MGKFSSFPSFCINNYLTHFLSSKQLIQSSSRNGIDELLGLWKNLGWYFWLFFLCWYFWLVFLCCCCWIVYFCACWLWFGPFWCWNILPKFRLKIISIIDWDNCMSIYDVSGVSKNSSIVGVKLVPKFLDLW